MLMFVQDEFMEYKHLPIMAREILEELALHPGDMVVDATVGLGGHTKLLWEAVQPVGELYGFERDARNLVLAKEQLFGDQIGGQIGDQIGGQNLRLINASYSAMGETVKAESVDGVLFDLGVASPQLDDPERGFSFRHDGPLDMRFDATQGITAAEVVNQWKEEDLAEVFRKYGEELRARVAMQAIVRRRREKLFTSTLDLAEVIALVIPRRGRIHPATKIFQALRIVVNDELNELSKGLEAAKLVLKPGGKLAVLTFHSLEDRIVKQFMNSQAVAGEVDSKKGYYLKPTPLEVATNPRSRSAKLRIMVK